MTRTDPTAPRHPDIRRQALHAAASVALAFSAGCAGAKPSAAPAPPGPTAATPTDAGAASTPPAARTTEPPATRADALPVCGELERDARYACCEALRTACVEKFSDNAEGKAAECMFGPNLNGSTGCTPWGPPVPPAMV